MRKRLLMLLMLFFLPFIVIYSIPRYILSVVTNVRRATLILIAYDQLANTLFNGDPDETISSRAGKAQLNGRKWGCVLCRILDKLDSDHCKKSIEYDRGRSLDNPKVN